MEADANTDNVYMVTVVVTDSKKLTAMRDVTITITNVDEDGTVTLSSEQPKVGIALTATLEDHDGVVADSVKWTWHSSADGTGTAIPMATSDTYTPKGEVAPVGDGELHRRTGFWQEHVCNRALTNNVVVNTANVAPKFPRCLGNRYRRERDADDYNGGHGRRRCRPRHGRGRQRARGPDTLTYTLSGTDAASFGIVRTSGQLQTKAKLDYESQE